jgi:predicted DNA-binding antitoxin AbrB/MazE fold protein
MATKYFPAIFEAGMLRPLAPLDLNEQERVEVALVRGAPASETSEEDYVPAIAVDADPAITLHQVQQALAKIPGSLVDDFTRERDERF